MLHVLSVFSILFILLILIFFHILPTLSVFVSTLISFKAFSYSHCLFGLVSCLHTHCTSGPTSTSSPICRFIPVTPHVDLEICLRIPDTDSSCMIHRQSVRKSKNQTLPRGSIELPFLPPRTPGSHGISQPLIQWPLDIKELPNSGKCTSSICKWRLPDYGSMGHLLSFYPACQCLPAGCRQGKCPQGPELWRLVN